MIFTLFSTLFLAFFVRVVCDACMTKEKKTNDYLNFEPDGREYLKRIDQ